MKQQNADGKGGWKRAARDGMQLGLGALGGLGGSRRGAEGVQGCRSEGMMSGVKGTELMQVLCSELGEALIHTKVQPIPSLPRGLEQPRAILACLSVRGYWAQSGFRRGLSSPALALLQISSATPWRHSPNTVCSQGSVFTGWILLGSTGADGYRLENQSAGASCARKAALHGK